jgi:hypothetical protein
MNSFYARIKRWATPRNALIGLALFIVNVLLLGITDGQLAALAGGEPKLDLRFGYTYDTVMHLFDSYGEAGRQIYLWNLITDTPFPLVVAVTTMLFVGAAFERRPLVLLLCIAPAVFFITDMIENALFLSWLAAYPDISPGAVAFGSVLTQIKRVGWYASALTTIASFVIIVIRALRTRFS